MPRPPRAFYAEGYYHVMSRGNKQAEIFHDKSDYELFLHKLLKHKSALDISIFNYCLIPNHFHLSLQPHTDEGSLFMQKVKSEYAMCYCFRYGHKGHVWQGRFKNEHINTDAYLLACGNYIEMNPVRAGLVADPADWEYSSFHYYSSGAPDPLIDENPLYQTLGRTPEERRLVYREQLSKTRSF